jgi:uncharacterized membrane protein SirB2
MHAYLALKAVHVFGVFLVVIGVAGIAADAASGRPKGENPASRLLAALHGLGLLIVLLAGFGMLAKVMRTPSMPSPAWATAKLAIWALFAAAAVIPRRWPRTARWVLVAGLPFLGAAAAVVAILKPF